MGTATENGKQQRNSEQQCDATVANEKLQMGTENGKQQRNSEQQCDATIANEKLQMGTAVNG